MASFTSVKVKDGYSQLLKTETSTLSSTRQTIEDGLGNDSALKLGTTSIEVNGDQYFTTAPSVDNAELTGIFIDGTNKLVRRELGANAFSATASFTAASPVYYTSNVVGLLSTGVLLQLTQDTISPNDGLLIYDTSATQYKGITIESLRAYLSEDPVFTAVSPVAYDSASGTFSLDPGSTWPAGALVPADNPLILVFDETIAEFGYYSTAELSNYIATQVANPPGGTQGNIQFNNAGAFAGSADLSLSGNAGARTLRFSGIISVVKESSSSSATIYQTSGSTNFGGLAEVQNLALSFTSATGAGVQTMITINNGSGFYKGAIIEYTLYNNSHSKFRTGRFATFFDSVGFTSVPGAEDIYYYQGAGWNQPSGSGGFSFRWYTTGAGVLTFTINNSCGEVANFRADVKLIASYV
jgi:hypothetical protein